MPTVAELERNLGLPLADVSEIKENDYCHIYRASSAGTPLIVKQYKGCDPTLARLEAEAVDYYGAFSRERPGWIDAHTIAFNADRNAIGLGFVPGIPLSELLRRARRDADARQSALRAVERLGAFLRHQRDTTQHPGEPLDPHLHEYIVYTSRRLRALPVLGRLCFKNAVTEAERLWEELLAADPTPSFIHGDFVCLNIHVDGDRVGLIDFANTVSHSHLLCDLYNFRIAVRNMLLGRGLREEVLAAFARGVGPLDFAEPVHRFFWEYHRRRWLMLKLKQRNPVRVVEGLRGLLRFAKPYPVEGLAP